MQDWLCCQHGAIATVGRSGETVFRTTTSRQGGESQSLILLLLLSLVWWLRWLDLLSHECCLPGCQGQIFCRPQELGFEGLTSGPYLLPCLMVEWAGLQVMFWCLVRLSTGTVRRDCLHNHNQQTGRWVTKLNPFATPHSRTASLFEWLRCPPWERKILGLNRACGGIFGESSHASDLKFGIPVATLPGVWCYRVSAGTGRPGVSILWLGVIESLICNFYLSVAARKIVWADLSLRHTRMLLGHKATNKQANLTAGLYIPSVHPVADATQLGHSPSSASLIFIHMHYIVRT